MPLRATVTINREYRMQKRGDDPNIRLSDHGTLRIAHFSFVRDLPGMVAYYLSDLGYGLDVKPETTIVDPLFFDSGSRTPPPNMWVRLAFTAEEPEEAPAILEHLYKIFCIWFQNECVCPDFLLELAWEPSRGFGTINGVTYRWG